MIRKANAVWKGGLKDGTGTVSVASGVITNVSYNFSQRFQDAPGTNPEELIAAAHAACFAMALSGELGKVSLPPESIETKATLTLEMLEKGPTTTKIHLDVVAKVPGAAADAFMKAAEAAKTTCPISRLLHTEITMDAKLA